MCNISVIMSVFNCERFVCAAVTSILNQTYRDFEFIIIDDGSTDNTSQILGSFRDPRIRLIRQSNMGLTKSLNRGLAIAAGNFIARQDADDFSHTQRIERQVDFLKKYRNCNVVGTWADVVDEEDNYIDELKPPWTSDAIRENEIINNCLIHGSITARKSKLIELGGYDEDFICAQDYDLWLRSCEHGDISNIPEKLYCLRRWSGSISESKIGEQAFFATQARRRAVNRGAINYSAIFPKVSVIVPTYNRPQLLNKSIASIVNQSYPNVEVVVVNDAGCDLGREVFNQLATLPHKYLVHENNRGLAAARNTGIDASTGKYIAYLDDDDVFYQDHISVLVNYMKSNNCKVAYTDAARAICEQTGGEYKISRKDIPYSQDFDYEMILLQNFIPVLCVMHERECIGVVGPFDDNLKRMEDWDLWIRMSREFEFHHIPQVTCEFRWHPAGDSMMTSAIEPFYWACLNMYYKYLSIASNSPKAIEKYHNEVTGLIEQLHCKLRQTSYANLDDFVSTLGEKSFNSVINRLIFFKDKYIWVSDAIQKFIDDLCLLKKNCRLIPTSLNQQIDNLKEPPPCGLCCENSNQHKEKYLAKRHFDATVVLLKSFITFISCKLLRHLRNLHAYYQKIAKG